MVLLEVFDVSQAFRITSVLVFQKPYVIYLTILLQRTIQLYISTKLFSLEL